LARSNKQQHQAGMEARERLLARARQLAAAATATSLALQAERAAAARLLHGHVLAPDPVVPKPCTATNWEPAKNLQATLHRWERLAGPLEPLLVLALTSSGAAQSLSRLLSSMDNVARLALAIAKISTSHGGPCLDGRVQFLERWLTHTIPRPKTEFTRNSPSMEMHEPSSGGTAAHAPDVAAGVLCRPQTEQGQHTAAAALLLAVTGSEPRTVSTGVMTDEGTAWPGKDETVDTSSHANRFAATRCVEEIAHARRLRKSTGLRRNSRPRELQRSRPNAAVSSALPSLAHEHGELVDTGTESKDHRAPMLRPRRLPERLLGLNWGKDVARWRLEAEIEAETVS